MEKVGKKKNDQRLSSRWSKVDKYDVDKLARDTSFWLARDFALVEPSVRMHPLYARSPWEPGLRDSSVQLPYWGSRACISRFKRQYQLANFLKKYTFAEDVFSPAERELETTRKFLKFQERLATPRKDIKISTIAVLREARRLITDLLGDYSEEEAQKHYRFGQKSSIGCSYAKAFLDVKLCERSAFTSNLLSAEALSEFLLDSPILREHLINAGLSDGVSLFPKLVESLIYRQVPKTYKLNRGITPLALLTLLKSYGLGGVVTERLKLVGIDISRQQQRHRRWIGKFSRTRSHCTTDLSSASDSITLQLLMWLLPRKWLKVVKTFISRTMEIGEGGPLVSVMSVLPMGNGATFPLETLIFWALLRALGNLTGIDGLFSVYGDDLIYPTRLHKYVVGTFGDLGILINPEKTFTDAFFRESCGSDYFHGVDVRPAFFPEAASELTRTQYVSHIYKVINALLARWDVSEVSQTISFLLGEIRFTGLKVFRVPRGFPAISGIQVDSPKEKIVAWPSDGYSPVAVDVKECGCVTHAFKMLTPSTDTRRVSAVLPYYWLTLRRNASTEVVIPERFWDLDVAIKLLTSRDVIGELSWSVSKRTRWFIKDGKRVKKVTSKWFALVRDRGERVKVGETSVYDWCSRLAN